MTRPRSSGVRNPAYPFAWTRQRDEVARLLADGRLSHAEIAARCGVSSRSIRYWCDRPEFMARVAEYVEAMRAAALAEGIADKRERLRRLNARWEALHRVIAERAASPAFAGEPGGATGLLTRRLVPTGEGVEYEYQLDAALLKELREHENDAARELGERQSRVDVTTAGRPLPTFADLLQLAGYPRAGAVRAAQLPAADGDGDGDGDGEADGRDAGAGAAHPG